MTVFTADDKRRLPALFISIAGSVLLLAVFVLWLIRETPSVPGVCAAALAVGLFALGCWQFVPEWLRFWFGRERDAVQTDAEPKHTVLWIALISLGAELLLFWMVLLVLSIQANGIEPENGIEFWRCLDSQHYMDIMREWYVYGEEYGRSVQLVFLPGYPLAVYPLYRLINYDLVAGILVSAAAFPAACCIFYRLLRLDYPHEKALCAVAFLWLLPGGFFFVAPMSESLFLLLTLFALYCLRKERFALAALCGAYAAFTRSLGLVLVAPMIFEWVHRLHTRNGKQKLLSLLPVLAIPLGFLGYLWINYHVSGNALQFLTFQRDHWGQQLGWFFNTAAYQTNLLLQYRTEDKELFFGLWLPNLMWIFGSLGLFAATAKRIRASYAVWFMAYFAIAIGTTWLLSAPRYLLAMPVIPLMIAQLCKKRRQRAVAACTLPVLSALYLIAFVLRWQVW